MLSGTPSAAGTASFTVNVTDTPGATLTQPYTLTVNATPLPWPGSASITMVDQAGVLGTGLSGLEYEGTGTRTPGVLWAVNSSSSALQRLLWNGTLWVRDTANGWSAGKTLHFTNGAGLPDSEGVTLTDAGAAGGVFVSSERDLSAGATSRISVLRYDVSGATASLTATREWNLTADLPPVAADAGAESVAWIPDSYLVGNGFVDVNTGQRYNPATYPNSAEANDRFGASLAAGNYRNTSYWDLAIGVPGESVGAVVSAGIVQILPGSSTFLTGTGSQTFGQNTSGVADSAEAFDAMGLALGR